MFNRLEIAELLLERGADLQIADSRGMTALETAKSNGHAALAERLLAVTSSERVSIPEEGRE